MKISDAILISKVILRDDHLAFKKLIERYQYDLKGLLLRLSNGNKDTVDDLAQETFIRVYKYLSGFNAKSQFKTWLFRIAYNVFYEHYKKHNKEIAEVDSLGVELNKY